jgi:hypothetical protein
MNDNCFARGVSISKHEVHSEGASRGVNCELEEAEHSIKNWSVFWLHDCTSWVSSFVSAWISAIVLIELRKLRELALLYCSQLDNTKLRAPARRNAMILLKFAMT